MLKNWASILFSHGKVLFGEGRLNRDQMDWFKVKKKARYFILAAALGAIPIIRLFLILRESGSDNPAIDEVFFISIVDRVLSGTYPWGEFFRDTLYGAHSQAVLGLAYLATAVWFRGSVQAALVVGLLLGLLKLTLIHRCLAIGKGVPLAWWLWPALAAVVFSVTQLSVYEWPLTALQYGLNQVGFIFGVWCLLRLPGRWFSWVGMVAGGLIASWTYSAGIQAWPVYLFLLCLSGRNRWPKFALWAVGVCIAVTPYLLYLDLGSALTPVSKITAATAFQGRWEVFFSGLGLPFSPVGNESFSGLVGMGGLLCWVGAGIGFWSGKRRGTQQGRPDAAVSLTAYGVLSLWQLSIFRVNLVPLYAALAVPFWAGLLGLLELFLHGASRSSRSSGFSKLWAVVGCVGLAVLYIYSNATYSDKVFYQQSRLQSSASCLRRYREMPTYCDPTVNQWTHGYHGLIERMAPALERHGLAPFGPRQVWVLQGDFIFNDVEVFPSKGALIPHWFAKDPGTFASFFDYRRLSLFIPRGGEVNWKFRLPATMVEGRFLATARSYLAGGKNGSPNEVGFELWGKEVSGESVKWGSWKNLSPESPREIAVELEVFAGKTVELALRAPEGGDVDSAVLLDYPRIELHTGGPDMSSHVGKVPIRFGNTEMSGKYPGNDWGGFSFPSLGDRGWLLNNTSASPETGAWWVRSGAYWEYRMQKPLVWGDYAEFRVPISYQPVPLPKPGFINQKPPLLRLHFGFENPKWNKSVSLPLLRDGFFHDYYYDLKLLEVPPAVKWNSLTVIPQVEGETEGAKWVRVGEMRALKR